MNSHPSPPLPYHHDDDDEDECECRVCRGPAEEGRPLFKPCKCSGSIAMTHQDCLTSWLEVKGGHGKCDLCGTKFVFAPKYAENAPAHLSLYQVLTGLFMRFASKWLPYALRICFVCGVWLGLLPLATAYLYQGWMHRPKSISSRLSWDLLTGDLVNGGILTVTIILSFLSLMSLADFLRFHWKRDDNGNDNDNEEDAEEIDDGKKLIEPDSFDRFDEDIDDEDGLFVEASEPFARSIKRQTISVTDEGNPFIPGNDNHLQRGIDLFGAGSATATGTGANTNTDTIINRHHHHPNVMLDIEPLPDHHIARTAFEVGGVAGLRRQRDLEICNRHILSGDDDDDDDDRNDLQNVEETDAADATTSDNDLLALDTNANRENRQSDILMSDDEDDDDDAMIERMMQLQEDRDTLDMQEEEDHEEEEPQQQPRQEPPPEDERFEPRFEPLDRPFDEEPMDVDMQLPLEQLIGLRGPLSEVFRNLCWLLAFQASFIAIFALIPCAIGSFTFSHFTRSTILKSSAHFILKRMLFSFFDLTSVEGQAMDLTYMVNITNTESENRKNLLQPEHGAKMVFGYLTMAAMTFSMQAALKLYLKCSGNDSLSESSSSQNFQREEIVLNMNHIEDIRMGRGVGRDPRIDPDLMRPEDMQAYILKSIEAVVDCGAAISKICILVCFKMFVLPLLLGTWLDLCTLKLFNVTIEDRLLDAGTDIFGFFLLHWVVGITFMLSVTVSVLQLREVLHPDLLAPMIRPQEPQTDVLASLLQESGWTHTRRMVPSVAIYAALLAIHVWLPCKVITTVGLEDTIPMFRPKFWHILNPSLQRTIELIVFHLAALSILEKHKNRIGEMQHKFLLKVSSILGITDTLLPLSTSKFVHVGDLPLMQKNDDGDSFWDELIELHKKRGPTDRFIESQVSFKPSVDENIDSVETVVLPNSYINVSTTSEKKLMRTRIGSYRFRRQVNKKFKAVIEVWKEVVDEPIPRPPQGWDYLLDGGAVEKGRWAWGRKEKKSAIEESVAERKSFFPPVMKNGKLVAQWKTRYFFSSGIPSIVKLLTVLISSWIGVSLCAAIILFGPLFIGRSVLKPLKVPVDNMHDPFVFLVGAIIMSPLVVTVVNAMNNDKKAQIDHNSNDRDVKFSVPPLAKLSVLAQTLFLWLGLCPLLAGASYDLFFAERGLTLKLEFNMATILNCWPVGFMLLHIWGALCYHGAFRASFWTEVRRLIIDSIAGGPAPGEENERERGQPRQNRAQNGVHGSNETVDKCVSHDDDGVNSFVEAVHAVLFKQEWDKIDHITLLRNCAIPVTGNLIGLLLIPLCACYTFNKILDATDESTKMDQFRWFALIVLILKFAYTFQSQLKSWYSLGHKTARDHRYLVGEILLDYKPFGEAS